MIDKILFLCPTRQRVSAVKELAQEFQHCATGYADLIFLVDGDHPNEHEYARACDPWHVAFGPWRGLVGTLNFWSARFAGTYRYIGFLGDDHRPRTFGFDDRLYLALRQLGVGGIAYGQDGYMNQSLPTWVAMDSMIVTTLGQMAPYPLRHNYIDNYWLSLGIEADTIRYLDDVLIEHMHPLAGKAVTDDSYELSSEHNARLADAKVWMNYKYDQLPRDAALLRRLRGT